MPEDTPPPTQDPNLVTATQAAFQVGVPVKQVEHWVKRGEIWPLANTSGSSGRKLYSLRRCKELAVGYHARKAARMKSKKAGGRS